MTTVYWWMNVGAADGGKPPRADQRGGCGCCSSRATQSSVPFRTTCGRLVYPFEQVFAKGFDVDPWEVFRQVKAEAPPVFYSPLSYSRDRGMWYVTTSEDVRTVFQDYSRFTTSFDYSAGGEMARRMLPLELDPPDHNKYRSLLTPLFSPRPSIGSRRRSARPATASSTKSSTGASATFRGTSLEPSQALSS